jgi:DNA modification methylase
MIYYSDEQITLFNGDCLELMDNVGKVDKIITSPPYPEHLKAKYECCEYHTYQASLCNIVSSILSHIIQFRD